MAEELGTKGSNGHQKAFQLLKKSHRRRRVPYVETWQDAYHRLWKAVGEFIEAYEKEEAHTSVKTGVPGQQQIDRKIVEEVVNFYRADFQGSHLCDISSELRELCQERESLPTDEVPTDEVPTDEDKKRLDLLENLVKVRDKIGSRCLLVYVPEGLTLRTIPEMFLKGIT